MNKQAFCTETYFTQQMNEFEHRVSMPGFDRTIIEFGGKGRGDQHAARVLPGYDKDIKAKILYGLQEMGMRLIMVLNTQDILQQPDGRTLQGRIRGDTGLRYHDEVVRQIDEAHNYGLHIEDVALSVFPSQIIKGNSDFMSGFQDALQTRGVHLHKYKKIAGYPDNVEWKYGNPFLGDSFVSGEKDIVLISPGGGSGKFGVAISEIAHQLYAGKNPNFIKFETFPVFELEYHHPLNLAFEAATADLKNEVLDTLGGVSYDKDIENHRLLLTLYTQLEKELPYFLGNSPVQFGVNKIHTGIVDGGKIKEACMQEIKRRIERYTQEVSTGNERDETLLRTEQIYSLFNYEKLLG